MTIVCVEWGEPTYTVETLPPLVRVAWPSAQVHHQFHRLHKRHAAHHPTATAHDHALVAASQHATPSAHCIDLTPTSSTLTDPSVDYLWAWQPSGMMTSLGDPQWIAHVNGVPDLSVWAMLIIGAAAMVVRGWLRRPLPGDAIA